MAGRREARRPGVLSRLGRALYRLAVVLSAVIVTVYAAYRFLVRPPEIPPAPAVPAAASASVSDEAPQPVGLVRRDQVYTFLLVGVDNGNGNADTLMVACFDVPEHRVGVVSVPRDAIVERSWSRYPKINGAYGKGGVELVRQEVSYLLGIPIDFTVMADLNGFTALVDAAGGVDFAVPADMDYDDPWQDLSIHFKKGMQHLTGKQAMEVARFRHNNDNTGYSDMGRTRTQQALLTAIAKKILSWNSLPRINEYLEIVRANTKTDLSLQDMAYFASQAFYVDLSSGVESVTLSGRGDARYHGYSWCYELDRAKTLEDVNRLLNPYTTPVTEEMIHVVKADSYG